eukprot:CAMPEP_0171522332 /NCGR_PEP_ID=MMETSP0959-20130129/7680_1 /TAXON_ID=87120 /ORGANISM="Aurantiochytrium limacinum, Strain ATCCMYA-1381" /LENGTH=66 /DNA_ID=CAMNT_0012062435 /DNA_START=1247 /DNA_END=1447 /DNA_ORIENTATION=-
MTKEDESMMQSSFKIFTSSVTTMNSAPLRSQLHPHAIQRRPDVALTGALSSTVYTPSASGGVKEGN